MLSVAYADDTTVPILAKGKADTGRIWTSVRDDQPFGGSDPPAALYFASRDRRQEHPDDHLANWRGVLQADAYGGYNGLYDPARPGGPVTSALCWAHARCGFFELADIGATAQRGPNSAPVSPIALEAVNRIDAIFAIERLPQRSPFELKCGLVIPATLITVINSGLPGRITAPVSQNVYDSATGHRLLIPQGTRLLGRYDSKVTFGQSRVLVVWTDIILPNGSTLQIGSMAGTDAQGYGGFSDKVNNHYLRTFGSAILIALIGAGTEMAIPRDRNSFGMENSAEYAARRSFVETFGRMAERTISRNMDVQPTLEIRSGYKFNILVDQDMVFPGEYRGRASHEHENFDSHGLSYFQFAWWIVVGSAQGRDVPRTIMRAASASPVDELLEYRFEPWTENSALISAIKVWNVEARPISGSVVC